MLGAALIVLLPGPNSMYVLSVAARRGVRRGYRAALGVFFGDTVLLTLTAAGAASLLGRSPALFDVVKYLGAAYLAWLGVGMIRAAVRGVRESRAKRGRSADAAVTAAAVAGRDAAVTEVAVAGFSADTAAVQASGAAGITDITGAAGPVEVTGTTGTTGSAGSVGGVDVAGSDTNDRSPLRRALIISMLNPKAILFDLAFLSQFVSPHAAHPATAFLLLGVIVQCFSVTYLSALILGGHRLADRFRRRRRLTASLTGGVGSLFLGFAVKLATASLG